MIWRTELRAMKTVVAGAVGANCGEASLTHHGPPPYVLVLGPQGNVRCWSGLRCESGTATQDK